ncbi:hypothetical protein [Arthrobacter sp. ISL-5]|uniref:hypothetical protein n=1 Tax=Arthrobacter sp. ISL-5 TaxID=2819111 RepID=UPI001BE7C5DB|nr:hypothetical protein [Arthrobacter sp. ISL-5]MBT2551588.1 hypothetical protein [Arthrobacter sp. ISL-5]
MPHTLNVDLRSYPHGSELHSQALNWLYANGFDAFTVRQGPVYLTGTHLTATLADATERTVAMRRAPEEFGLRRIRQGMGMVFGQPRGGPAVRA